MEKYRYFVSYSHSTGSGNLFLEISEIISSKDHIQKIEAGIVRDTGLFSPVIINFILI